MKRQGMKRLARMLVLAVIIALAAPLALPAGNVTAQAAAVKLSAKKKTITVGKSFTLKISGTDKQVKWSSSKKSVATVSKKGKVTGKSAGKAVITAKVGGKSYKCTVTVKEKDIYISNAPYDAERIEIGSCTMVVPKGWDRETESEPGVAVAILYTGEGLGNSNITVLNTQAEGLSSDDFEFYLDTLKASMTEEYFRQMYLQQTGIEAEVSNLEIGEQETDWGRVVVITYDIDLLGVEMTQIVYEIIDNDSIVELTATVRKTETDDLQEDIADTAEYMVNSLKWTASR